MSRTDDLEKLIALVPSGVLMVAPAGSGRSFFLAGLARRLGRVVWLGPGQSVAELLANLQIAPDQPTRPASLAAALRRALAGAVLVADDVERLDSLSRRALEQLARLTPPAGGGWVLSVLACDLSRFPRSQQVALAELEELELRALLPADLARPQQDFLLEYAHGSPRQLKVLTLAMRLAGALPPGEPDIVTVLEALPEEAHRLLALACLAQEPFPRELLARAAGLTAEQAEGPFRLLWEGGLLEEGRVGPPALRRDLPLSLPHRLRAQYHAELARALEELGAGSGARGRQLVGAGRTSDAAWLLMEGGQQAHEAGLLEEALQLWEMAASCLLLGDPRVGAARIETLLALGRVEEAERWLGKLNDSPEVARARARVLLARGDAEGALRQAPDPDLKAEALLALGRRQEALEQARGLRLARLYLELGDVFKLQQVLEPELKENRFEALLLLAEAQHLGGRGERRLEEALALAREQRIPEREAAALMLQARLGDDEAAAARAVELLRPGGESPRLVEALVLLARLRPSQARALLEESVAASDVVEEAAARSRARLGLGRWLRDQGEPAREVLLEAAQLARGHEQRAEALVELARAVRSDREQAPELAELAVAEARASENPKLLGLALLAQGEIQVDGQQWEGARETLARAEELPLSQRGQKARLYEAQALLHEQAALQQVPGFSLSQARRYRQLAREQDRSRPRRRPRLWAAVLLLAALLVAFLLWPRPTGVTVEAEPAGAKVLVDGQSYTAPCKVSLAPGAHEVKVLLPGYSTYRQRVELGPGETRSLTARLQPAAGTLRVETLPPGARIYLNDQARGLSPLALDKLDPGRYRVKAVLSGYQNSTGAVEVVGGQTRSLSLKLRKNR